MVIAHAMSMVARRRMPHLKIWPRVVCAAHARESHRDARDAGDGACAYRDARGPREIFRNAAARRGSRCTQNCDARRLASAPCIIARHPLCRGASVSLRAPIAQRESRERQGFPATRARAVALRDGVAACPD
jgi:hypothetical protein